MQDSDQVTPVTSLEAERARRRSRAKSAGASTERADLIRGFDQLPNEAMVDVEVVAAVEDAGQSTIWRRIKEDPDHPQPRRISARCTRFKVGEIRAYLEGKKAGVSACAVAA